MKRAAFLAAALLALAAPAFSQTLTFTLETSSADGKSVTPRLTWSTTPAAASCTASGATDWTGTKAAAGTQILAPVTSSKTFTLVCNWPGDLRATVNWVKVTTNADGSAYTNPGGYRVLYGPSASNLNQSAYIQDPNATSWQSPTLAAGAWYFGVLAYNDLGLEGAVSNVASKTLTAGASQTRALELTIRFPSAPVLTVQ